jgi:hypothetical protein
VNVYELTEARIDDAVGFAQDFMQGAAGLPLDGEQAAGRLKERILTAEEVAEGLLTDSPQVAGQPDYRVVLSSKNAEQFDAALNTLHGYNVLVPSALVGSGEPAGFYRGTVMGNDESGALRLHVFRAPFSAKQELPLSVETVLSAAAQAEAASAREHGARKPGDQRTAEHLATLVSAAIDPAVAASWQRGDHVDQNWRTGHLAGRPAASVTSEMHSRTTGSQIEVPIMLTREDFEQNRALLLWHDSMRGPDGKPERADKQEALVVVQALAVQDLKAMGKLDEVKGFLRA